MGIFAGAEANREKDPELRRCLELGGMLDACEDLGAMEGMASILMPFAGKPDPNEPPPVAGVVLVGTYHSRSQLPSLSFGNGSATIQDCGSLIPDNHDYTLRKSGNTVQLVLANEPEPIVVAMQPDGTLSGPGLCPRQRTHHHGLHHHDQDGHGGWRSCCRARILLQRPLQHQHVGSQLRTEDRTLHHWLHGVHTSKARCSG